MTAEQATTYNGDTMPLVLIIDDSSDVHRLLRARLKHESVRLAFAEGGQPGIDAARVDRPDLILLDLDMPDIDGFEVLRILKDNTDTVNTPVIVLSGLQSPTDKVTAFDLGAVDYITKPFDLMELRVRVRSALRMHQLLQMLEQRAHIDGLTGLWNRKAFDDRIAESIANVDRHDRSLSVALMDLDHFKSLNDTFGHPAGDNALRVFAKIVGDQIRTGDIACRYGGEEFALVMPDTGPEDAAQVCERIGAALRETHWPQHPERRVTVSIGIVGSTDGASVSADEWVSRADACLYKAKTGGRDRVEFESLERGAKLAQAG